MQIESKLRDLVKRINSDPKCLEYIRKWLGDYPGKILSWRIGDSRFYMVIKPEGVEMHSGEYPSPDICWLSDERSWVSILEGRMSSKDALTRGRVWIWGNYHEWERFQRLLEILRGAHQNSAK